MNKIAILYGTSTGNTESVAMRLNKLLDNKADLYNVADLNLDEVKDYPYLILGTSTTGSGDVQDDWDSFLPIFETLDLKGKTVAIFGLGDSVSFSTTFVGSMRHLYDAVKDKAKVIGSVSTDGYTYDETDSVINGRFVGLALDEENEADKTDSRLAAWAAELKKNLM